MSTIHVLLVGIDHHVPGRFSGGVPIRPLVGAVNDVARMRSFLLRGPFTVPPERIRQLVSPHPWMGTPQPEDLPTRENLVREIRALANRAAPGDQVLIHYAGHGARLPTAVAEVKGLAGRDECLVPCDAGAGEGRFLRDVELHSLFRELASSGLLVTFVADCCHSGGVVRTGGRTRVRGLGDLPFPPPEASPLGDWPELAAAWGVPRTEPGRPSQRRLEPDAGLLPMPAGCVLLAACRPGELAEEGPLGGGFGGVLTDSLLDILGEADARQSYREVHRRVKARVRSRGRRQTPALVGDRDRAVLGDDRRRSEGSRAAAVDPLLIDPLGARPSPGAEHFQAIDGLTASPSGAGLAQAIEIEIFALDQAEAWWSLADRRPVDPARVAVGTLLCLLLRNVSDQELEVAVLDLRCDGGIERLHPHGCDAESSLLDPGGEQPVFFRAELPEGAEEGHDRIQILVATGPLATDHLEQGAFREAGRSGEASMPSAVPAPPAGRGEPVPIRIAGLDAAWAARAVDLILRRADRSRSEPWWTTG